MEFKKKFSIKRILCLLIVAIVLTAFVVGDVLCAKYEFVITTLLCDTGTDFDNEKTQETLANNDLMVQKLAEEGVVLLKNDNQTLPLKEDELKVNLFGIMSYDKAFLLSGRGSAKAAINDEKKVTLSQGLKSEGIEVNEQLMEDYNWYKGGSWSEGLEFYEPPVSFYGGKAGVKNREKTVLQDAKDFSKVAVVVFTRLGGEGWDLPSTQTKWLNGKKTVDDTRTSLELTTEEEDMLNLVCNNFEKVIVLINSGSSMQLDFLKNDKIGAALNVCYPGQSGTKAIARILKGTVNPSGRTADTFVSDLKSNPSYANAEMTVVTDSNKHISYTEGIYVGYKWYETAEKEGYFDITGTSYDDEVVYPFGYGLSYTTFEKKIIGYELSTDGDDLQSTTTVEVAVSVTNTGKVAGKDVIELYYTPPYYSGGIEKAHVNLLAFEKTSEIDPGETKNYKLTFTAYDMASYDSYDANKNGNAGWELEKGLYKVQLLENAHSWKGLHETSENTIKFNLKSDLFYTKDPVTGNTVENRYGDFDSNGNYIVGTAYANVPIDGSTAGKTIKWLSRENFIETFPRSKTSVRDNATLVKQANDYIHTSAYSDITEEPTQGVSGDLYIKVNEDGSKPTKDQLKINSDKLVYNHDLVMQLGADYDCELWDKLLNQLTKDDLLNFVESSGYGTDAAESVGKPYFNEYDGGSGFNANAGIDGFDVNSAAQWTGFCNATLWAQTWNKELMFAFGQAIGEEGLATNVSGWYAPTVNLHRAAINGRNFEAFSEDAVLSGYMAANVISGAKTKMLRVYLKHLVLSEEGPNPKGLNVWITEQNLRENYLKAFEIAVKVGGANSVMSSFNNLGGSWTGGNYALITDILRNEWGFKGTVITDWCVGTGDMTVERGIHGGNDIWLSPQPRCNSGLDESSVVSWTLARRSAKNLLYSICNTYYAANSYDPDADLSSVGGTDVFRWWIPVLVFINVTVVAACAFSVYTTFFKKKKPIEVVDDLSDVKTE